MTLEEKLALSKEQQQKIENGIKAIPQQQNKTPRVPSTMKGSVDSLTEAVFGEYKPKGDGTDPYDPNEEMKRIQERREHGAATYNSNSKLPEAIKQSILSNPLDMPSVDPKMDAFTEKLSKALPKTGFNRSYEIQTQLDSLDKKNIAEQKQAQQQNNNTVPATSGVDYEMIKMIIENIVDKKLSSLQNTILNESKNHEGASLKAMKLGKKFLFLDDDNNVFECQLKFIGKNKKKQTS